MSRWSWRAQRAKQILSTSQGRRSVRPRTSTTSPWLVSGALVLTLLPVAQAHHSISGVYDTAQPVTVEGTIAQYQHVNPHPYMIVDVRRGDSVEKWYFELDNRRELADIGITETTFKAGDRIVVIGSPARAEARKLYVERLDRPADGFGFEQVRNSPRLRSRGR